MAGLQPAWLLHSRPYREQSVIASYLVAGSGRIDMVVNGVRQRKNSRAALLQPFSRVLLSWKGHQELKKLVAIEPDLFSPGSGPLTLNGRALFCGFYINEVVLRALLPGQSAGGIISLYERTIRQLANAEKAEENKEPYLRGFELDLLSQLGYAPTLDYDVTGDPLQPDTLYHFQPEQGFYSIQALTDQRDKSYDYPAEVLLAMSRRDFSNPGYYRWFKRFTRQALVPVLGHRPLSSRSLFMRQKPH
ncbi:DNA repair protein RecO [invertebrate metagenome]|uniref:DNA repair protein RecO n=1 Tax=invertebrate metagenome TaxID=1711999 RepID=A0A2H9T8D3_9ZZZZ